MTRSVLNRYEDPWTADVYDYQVQVRGDDVPFWLALAQQAEGEVLELACGTGRVLLPLARAGVHITGLDISDPMLSVARRKLEQEPTEVIARVALVRGDMRQFALGRRYALVIIPFRAFQALLTRTDQRSCLEQCRGHLAPGGGLAVDVFNPRLSRLASPTSVQEGPRDFPGPEGQQVRLSGEVTFDLTDQTLHSLQRYRRTFPDGSVVESEHLLTLHYFFRFEMEWMLEACGFEVEALYGDFDRSEFTAESGEMIFVARRRDE